MTTDPTNASGPSAAHERVRAVFFQVCDLQGAERDAVLVRECGADEALRKDVLRLLKRDAIEFDLLADDAVDAGSAFGAIRLVERDAGASKRAASPERFPEEIGGYRILRRIGVGGMGTVYEAEQQDPRRIVALKTLQRWSASTSLLRRFRHEAQVLGRLQHPGIAQIFEARVHDPGDGTARVPFFVMELIRGQPIAAFVRERSLSVAERLRLFVRVCDAVSYAHQNGVIHRDLKPDNILVDEMGQPKILDFGIAKTTDSDQQVTTLQTDVGQLLGTLPYMSPEQVGGNPSLVDQRSDVYSLGVVLYEMLTGQLPCPVRDRSIPDAIRAIREESHTRLSAIDRSLRGDLETILSTALEKSVDRRYQSVPQLSQDVQRYLENEPISARPPSTFYQLSKFARRNKVLVGGVVAVIVALALGTIATAKFAIDAAASAREASARAREERWSSYLSRIEAAAAALERRDVPAARRHLAEAPEEHRGWEWRHLARTAEQSAVEIECDADIVGRAAFLPGGDRVVAGLADGRVCAWDVASGRMIRTITVDGGVDRVADAELAPIVAVATWTGEVAVIDVDAGVEMDRWKPRGEALAEREPINDVALSADGAMVVIASPTGVTAWDRREHRVAWRSVLPAASSPGFTFVTVSADGSLVAGLQAKSQGRGVVRAWSLLSGEERGQWRSRDVVTGIAVHPRAREIAVGSGVRDVTVVPTSTMQARAPLAGHTSRTERIAYSPDGRWMASQSNDSTIRVRSADQGTTVDILHVPADVPANGGLAFSSDGSRLVSRGPRTIVVWDVPTEPALVLRGHQSYVYEVAFSPDGSMLASSPFQGDQIRIWDPRSGTALAEHEVRGRTSRLHFSGDQRFLEIQGARTQVWDLATGALSDPQREATTAIVRSDGEQEATVEDVPAAPSGETSTHRWEARVVPRTADGNAGVFAVELRRVGEARPPAMLTHDARIVSTAFSYDQSRLAVGCENGEIVVWDVARQTRLAVLRRHAGRVYALAFSPDGRRLASGGNDNSLRLWDTATWDQVLERHEHASYVHGVAFSPDGTQIATASGDMTVRVWDSVDRKTRLAQDRAAAAFCDEMRPKVQKLLIERGADEAATALASDRSFDDDHRRAAMRTLIEATKRP
ncbi:MAG: protein kinase [Phycisphaerales bacterium]